MGANTTNSSQLQNSFGTNNSTSTIGPSPPFDQAAGNVLQNASSLFNNGQYGPLPGYDIPTYTGAALNNIWDTAGSLSPGSLIPWGRALELAQGKSEGQQNMLGLAGSSGPFQQVINWANDYQRPIN